MDLLTLVEFVAAAEHGQQGKEGQGKDHPHGVWAQCVGGVCTCQSKQNINNIEKMLMVVLILY